MIKSTTFYEALQKDEGLDLRDNRGKQHEICLILIEFVIALLCHRDGKMSSVHRHMKAHHTKITKELGMEATAPKKQYQGLIYPYCWGK